MFDANGQSILRYIVATGYGLLLETIVGKGKVQLIPAIALLQLIGSLSDAQQEQQRQDALEYRQHVVGGVGWAGLCHDLEYTCTIGEKKKQYSFPFLGSSFAGLAARRRC